MVFDDFYLKWERLELKFRKGRHQLYNSEIGLGYFSDFLHLGFRTGGKVFCGILKASDFFAPLCGDFDFRFAQCTFLFK